MTVYIIILIVATIGVALVTFVEGLSKNKIIKYGAYIAYFLLIELILFALSGDFVIPAILLGVLAGVFVLVLIIRGSFIASSSNRIVKYVISFVFLAFAIFAGYKLYDSIMNPIRFNDEMTKRYQETVDELKMVRTAQIAYKNEYNKYTPDIDSLKLFIEEDSLTVIRKEGEVPDSIYLQFNNNLQRAEKFAVENGMIKRDTVRQSIIDTLFRNYDLDRFGYVPFTENLKFEMDTAAISAGGLQINVFEAKVPNLALLKGMDKQLVLNLNDDALKNSKYPGLKVGSLQENNNNEGNWDKEYDLKK